MLYNDFRKEKMKALKEKDHVRNNVITGILSDLIYIKKEKGQEPTEADSAKVVAKRIKQLKETRELSASRPDKLEEIDKELAILEEYMPKQLSKEEIEAEVKKILAQAGLEPIAKNRGQIMKAVMGELNGKADGKVINQVVGALING
jgi:uncharacterized protein YqeY